jgi:anion-transporting  ArsA/GET3 family ATPase
MRDAAKLYIRLKDTLNALSGRERQDPLKIIGKWEKLAKDVLDMIRSENTTAFLVTIPESLGVNQTERIKEELERFNVNVGGIIINNIISPEDSNVDLYEKRKEVNEKYIKIIDEKYRNKLPIKKLKLQEYEVKGVDALQKFQSQLFSA